MSSFSGGDSLSTQNPVSIKLKSTKNKISEPSSGFMLVSYNPKSKYNKNTSSPVSSSLHHIIDNPLSLCNTDTAFIYNNILSSTEIKSILIVTDDADNGNDRGTTVLMR